MAETQAQKKKRKRKQLSALLQVQEEEVAVQNAVEVSQVLEELEQQGQHVDILVCPKCKSPRLRRVKSTGGDLLGHMGIVPPSYECPDCGWKERFAIKATNKPLNVRHVELIREAMEADDETK